MQKNFKLVHKYLIFEETRSELVQELPRLTYKFIDANFIESEKLAEFDNLLSFEADSRGI